MLIKGLPEQIKNPNVNAGGGVWCFSLWINNLALHSWLEESKTHKRQLLKENSFLRSTSEQSVCSPKAVLLGPLLPPTVQFSQGPASPMICSLFMPIGLGLHLRHFSLGIKSFLLFLFAACFYFKLPWAIAKVISNERSSTEFSLPTLCCISLVNCFLGSKFCNW